LTRDRGVREHSRKMTRTHARTAAVLLAALALIPAAGRAHGATAHRRPQAERCSTGRFLVQAQPLIAGSQTPAPDVIVLGTRELALGSGCPPAPRHLVETRKRTTLHASWAGCQGLKGKVRLTARIDASCETMVGTLRARRFKRRFTAKAARCGDGVVEVGEECEPPGSAGCDASCHLADASIVPLPGRIQLPTGLAIDPTTLSVRDLLGSAVPTAAGQFSLPAVGAEGTLAVVVGPTGAPLLLGWLDRDHPVISARTTAETFAFAAVGGTMVSADAQAKVRLLLDALPEIQPLADAMLQFFAYDIHIRRDLVEHHPGAGATIRAHIVRQGVIYDDGDVRVTAFKVEHPPVNPAYGYRFDSSGHSIVISGDTRPNANLIKFAKGADILVQEAYLPEHFDKVDSAEVAARLKAYHTSAEEAGEIATAAGVKTLVLTHLVPAGAEATFAERAAKTFHGRIIVGGELKTITINGDTNASHH